MKKKKTKQPSITRLLCVNSEPRKKKTKIKTKIKRGWLSESRRGWGVERRRKAPTYFVIGAQVSHVTRELDVAPHRHRDVLHRVHELRLQVPAPYNNQKMFITIFYF